MGIKTTRPSRIAIPSDRAWFDPKLITLSTSVRITPMTSIASTPLRVANRNAERVALAVLLNAGAVTNPRIAPHSNPANFPWALMTAGNAFAINLFEGLSLVTGEWWYHGETGTTMLVIETLRRPGA